MIKYLLIFILLPHIAVAQFNENEAEVDDIDKINQERLQYKNSINEATSSSSSLTDNYMTRLMNDKMKAMALKMLQENPLSMMDKMELRDMITSKFIGTKFGKFMDENPKVMNIIVDVAHDKRALPSFFNIVNKPDEMKKYGFFILAVTAIAFIINLFHFNMGLFKRILLKLFIMISVTVLNLGAFYYFFQQEVGPSLEIVLNNF